MQTIIETLRSRFGYLTANGKPRFALGAFILSVCPYLGWKTRGGSSRLPYLFFHSFTLILAENLSSRLHFFEIFSSY